MPTFTCAGCDADADTDALPSGWSSQPSALGQLDRCPACTHKVAPRIVSERLAAGPGHNSGDDVISGAAQGRLKSFIERIERLEEDKRAVSDDLKEVYSEAKGEGFDSKILKKVVKIRSLDPAARAEEEALIELYMSAVEK